MLCYPFEERRLRKWNTGVYVQPKLNGERGRAILDGSVVFLSSEARPQEHVDHLYDELHWLAKKLPSIELDGEVYTHGKDNFDINSLKGRTTAEYHIFDIVSTQTFEERNKLLQRLASFDLPSHIKIVPFIYCEGTTDKIFEIISNYVEDGYEGVVIRHPQGLYERKRSTRLMKYKPHQVDTYEIVGSEEEHDIYGSPKNRLGALVLSSDEGTIFRVGTGFKSDQRQDLWNKRETLVGRWCMIKYQALSPKRIPYHSVFIEII